MFFQHWMRRKARSVSNSVMSLVISSKERPCVTNSLFASNQKRWV